MTPVDAWYPSPVTAPLTYPGRIPDRAYVIHGGEVHQASSVDVLDIAQSLGVGLDGRTAVLASGSSAAPARLLDKCGHDASIPVMRCSAARTAIVFSAHITRYGSIAATRIEHAESTSEVHVPLFDEQQLAQVDATERSYERAVINSTVPGWAGPVFAYRSQRGALRFAGRPIRIAEMDGGGPLQAMTQVEVLGQVAALTGLAASGAALADGVAAGSIDQSAVNLVLRSLA